MCIWLTANLASNLQVSTSDGRIKIIGHEGVEKTIRAADHTGTRHIQFLVNKGAVLRVTEVQGLQSAWSSAWQSAWHCCTRRQPQALLGRCEHADVLGPSPGWPTCSGPATSSLA